MMKKTKTFTFAILLLITLGLVAYLDSPYSIINKNYSYTAKQPIIAKPANATPDEDQPEVVEKLEKKEKVDGYIVETYEEYEIVRDKNGKIKKSEPTGKEDTLKYWDYNNDR